MTFVPGYRKSETAVPDVFRPGLEEGGADHLEDLQRSGGTDDAGPLSAPSRERLDRTDPNEQESVVLVDGAGSD
jgi:hypothetical protein